MAQGKSFDLPTEDVPKEAAVDKSVPAAVDKPATAASAYGIVPAHPVPDGSGGMTNLSDADYQKMFGEGKAGKPLTVVPAKGKPPTGKSFDLQLQQDGQVPKGTEGQSPAEAPIDYSQGAPLLVRMDFQAAANEQEAALALSQYYPPEDFGKTDKGEWWVKKDGVKVPVLPSDNTWGAAASNFATSALANASPVAGAALGAEVGSAGGPGGMALGAGLGGIGGYALQQAMKSARGMSEQSPKEAAGNIAMQGALNTIMQGALPSQGMNATRREFFGVTPESQARLQRLQNESKALSGTTYLGNAKLYTPYETALPASKILPTAQRFWNQLITPFGMQATKNLMRSKVEKLLVDAGFKPEQIAGVLQSVERGEEIVPPQRAGQAVAGAVQARQTELEKALVEATKKVDLLTQQAEDDAKRLFSNNDPALSRLLHERLVQVRTEMSAAYKTRYDTINEITGNKEVVPLEGTIMALRKFIADEVPEGVPLPPIMQRLANRVTKGDVVAAEENAAGEFGANHGMELPVPRDTATIKEVQDTRAWIRSYMLKSRETSLTPGVAYHNFDTVEKALTDSLDEAAKSGGLAEKAVSLLNETNAAYKADISRFKSTSIKGIIKDAQDGVFANPEVVAKRILGEGAIAEARQVMGLLPPEMQQQVGRVYMADLLKIASRADALSGKTSIDPQLLADLLKKNAKILDTFMPPGISGGLSKLAQLLAAKNLKLLTPQEMSTLTPGGIKNALEARLARQVELDTLVKTDAPALFMAGKTDTEAFDTAANWAVEPGKSARTAEVMHLLGKEEGAHVQKFAWNKILEESMQSDVNGNIKINSERMRENFNKFSQEQRDLLFPNGLGEDMLRLIRDNEFLFPKLKTSGAGTSLAAAAIALHTGIPLTYAAIHADGKLALLFLHSYLWTRPAFVKWLAVESQHPTGAIAKVSEMVRLAAVQDMLSKREVDRPKRQ